MNKKHEKTMNKWLNLLSKKLSGLKTSDRKDVIENYKDLWTEEFAQGKTTNEILLNLRPINEIAKELYEEFGIIKNQKQDYTKIKIVNSKTESTASVFKTINNFFLKILGFSYSILAIVLSLTFFLSFVAIVVTIPVALVLSFMNYEFMVVLPVVLVILGIGIFLAISFYFLSASSYSTVKIIFKRWFVKEAVIKDKKRIYGKLMLIFIIIAGSLTGIGGITATVGKNSIYGSVISNKLLNSNRTETFDLNKIEEIIGVDEFTEKSKVNIIFDWGYTPWTIFEVKKDNESKDNTISIQKSFNFKESLGKEFEITQMSEKTSWSKQRETLDIHFKIYAPWNAKFLSITPIKYEISYKFNIKGIQPENVFIKF